MLPVLFLIGFSSTNIYVIYCEESVCRKKSDELKDQRLHCIEMDDPTHEGIKTVPVEKSCEFSTGSVLCICIVTWNMNGKVDVSQKSCL